MMEFGAQVTSIWFDDKASSVVVDYDLVEAKGQRSPGGQVRVMYAALDLIDSRLGGKKPLTNVERIDLTSKFILPLIVARFEQKPQDVTIQAHGEIVAVGAI